MNIRTFARTIGQIALAALATGLLGAAASARNDETSFGNRVISLDWQNDGHLSGMRAVDHANNRVIAFTAPFALHLADGTLLTPAELVMQGQPKANAIAPAPEASRLAERKKRAQLETVFVDKAGRFRVEWRLIQVADASYLRAEVTVTALKQDEAIPRIDLFEGEAPGAEVFGRVDGSPVVIGPDYLQFENPLSKASTGVDHPTIRLWIDRALPLEKGKSITYSAAVGTTAPGQLRRDFQTYVEDQRAHPYRPYLHYNSWYDIGYFTPYTADEAVGRINIFCRELSEKRGTRLDSFLFDDGWDDRSGSWKFSKDFPDGFVPLRDAAAKCGAAPGIWLSPWGGYGRPKAERIAAGGKEYETIDGGFALSGPKYYQRFHDVALDLLTRQGINQFKFDGTGNASRVIPGSRFNSDFDAALALIHDLRATKPDLFINLTTGTYPSPAWLRYADTIWRDGEDHDFAGVGNPRERWITYRDKQVYENDVVAGPLFPLNSLMLHGIIYAQHAVGLNSDPQGDFANEVHSYFGSGTELQELYITPSLLTPQNWDMLAEAAKWSRANSNTLKDTHWIGGNPGHLDVYGWAAWSPQKSIITLRNPDARPQSFLLDLARTLELPQGAPNLYAIKVMWSGGANPPATLAADHATTIALAPFEVLTLELSPRP
ncbi:hypothetical protein [Sphingomonas sp. PR090111-T3T-6A]|uniref:hypothetical protein n=1 Tax=Sphingomonas sp. PR090111-T3T-6A TaxID=685778 RepID=UPI0003723143|nr:hypothetical protein [Sphingomonas sp. PR090111-T3T-6A]